MKLNRYYILIILSLLLVAGLQKGEVSEFWIERFYNVAILVSAMVVTYDYSTQIGVST